MELAERVAPSMNHPEAGTLIEFWNSWVATVNPIVLPRAGVGESNVWEVHLEETRSTRTAGE